MAPESRVNKPATPLFNNHPILISTYSSNDLIYSTCTFTFLCLPHLPLYICLSLYLPCPGFLSFLASILHLFYSQFFSFSPACKFFRAGCISVFWKEKRGIAACLGIHAQFKPCQHLVCTHPSLFSFQVKPHRASLYAWIFILSFYMLLHISQRKETLVAKQEKQGKWKHWAVRNLTLLQECRKRTGRELCYFSVFAQTNVFAITLCKQCINWYALVVKKIPHGLQADHLIWKLHKRSTKEERKQEKENRNR